MDLPSRQTFYTTGSDLNSSFAVNSSWAGLFESISQQSILWPEHAKGIGDKPGLSAIPTQSAAFAALFGDTATSHASSMQAPSQEAVLVTRPSSVASLCDSATSFSFGLPRSTLAASRQASLMHIAPQQDEQSQRAGHKSMQLDKDEYRIKDFMPSATQLPLQPSLSLTLKQWQTHVAEAQCSISQPDETGATFLPHQARLEQDRICAEPAGLQHSQLKLAAPDNTNHCTRGTVGLQSEFAKAVPPNKRARRSTRHNAAEGLSYVSHFIICA